MPIGYASGLLQTYRLWATIFCKPNRWIKIYMEFEGLWIWLRTGYGLWGIWVKRGSTVSQTSVLFWEILLTSQKPMSDHIISVTCDYVTRPLLQ